MNLDEDAVFESPNKVVHEDVKKSPKSKITLEKVFASTLKKKKIFTRFSEY